MTAVCSRVQRWQQGPGEEEWRVGVVVVVIEAEV